MFLNTENICKNCKHYTCDNLSETKGFCVKYPPRVITYGSVVKTVFPEVSIDNWCSEYKHRRSFISRLLDISGY